VAGGLPDAPRKYSGISSKNKKSLLWNFFSSKFKTENMLNAKTVYSGKDNGATIRELITEMNDGDSEFIHSIEHVVPKSYYEDMLKNRLGERKSNGASVNPLNFLPSHSTVNSKRGNKVFDFDGNTVESETLAKVDGDSRNFQAGFDKDEEWVVEPLLTRGDIARCVMYMEMMYELNYVDEMEMKKLQEWMKEDEPSDYERAFGLWLRETQPLEINVQNPFVSNPELVSDGMFPMLLNSYLKKNLELPNPSNPTFGGIGSELPLAALSLILYYQTPLG
jgi:endonuclease I